MYHAHFGLEKGLFGEGIAADTAVFRSPKHDRLIAHFKLALGSRSSVVVLRGPAGVGKTTLTSAALRMTSTRLALAWLDGTATNGAELLELILVELGMSTARTTRIERLQLWRQFQAETRATDSRLFIVVERAEDLAPEVLQALDQHTAPDAAGNPGASLVLLGSDGIDAHLAAPILAALRQRIRLRTELEPFTEAELQDYLRHQAACAGGTFDRIFAPGTVAALFRYSRGVARLANTLCESALHFAAVQQQTQLTADLVTKTAVSLLGLGEAAPAASPAPAVAVVAPAPAVVAPAAAVVTPAPTVVTPAPAVIAPAAAVSVVSAPAVERRLTPRPAATAPTPPPEPRPAVALTPPTPTPTPAPIEPVAAKPLATAVVSPPPAAPAASPAAARGRCGAAETLRDGIRWGRHRCHRRRGRGLPGSNRRRRVPDSAATETACSSRGEGAARGTLGVPRRPQSRRRLAQRLRPLPRTQPQGPWAASKQPTRQPGPRSSRRASHRHRFLPRGLRPRPRLRLPSPPSRRPLRRHR